MKIDGFVQCTGTSECESKMDEIKAGFVAPDHRIYPEIEFWDDTCVYYLPAKTIKALYDLQSQMEMMNDSGHEMGFGDVTRHAKELEDVFKKAKKAIKFKPLRRKERNWP